MLVLTVISYNGNPTNPFSATFDERGGAIGRADNNHMVLPDAERTVSRRHARSLSEMACTSLSTMEATRSW